MWQCTWSPIRDSVADPGLSRGNSNSEGIRSTTSLLFCTTVDENCMKIKKMDWEGRAFFVLPRSVTEIYDLSSWAIEVPWPDVLRETGLTSLRMSPRGTFRIPSHNIDNYWLQFPGQDHTIQLSLIGGTVVTFGLTRVTISHSLGFKTPCQVFSFLSFFSKIH